MTIVEQGVERIKANILQFKNDPETAARAVRWFDEALDSHDTHIGAILTLVLEGFARMSACPLEGPRFMLTEQGRAFTLDLLERSPAARDVVKQLTGRTFVPAPAREQ